MKPLSETRKENGEEFENHCFVVDACRSCSGLGKHIDLQTTSNTRTCERCLGTGNEKEEYYRLKSFLSTAESRILSAIKEKIDEMNEVVRHHESCLNTEYGGTYCDCGHPEQFRAHNKALSDLKSFIEEGMKPL